MDPHPQSSHCSFGAIALLVSDDSFGSLPVSQDSPLGYRFPHSPQSHTLAAFAQWTHYNKESIELIPKPDTQ